MAHTNIDSSCPIDTLATTVVMLILISSPSAISPESYGMRLEACSIRRCTSDIQTLEAKYEHSLLVESISSPFDTCRKTVSFCLSSYRHLSRCYFDTSLSSSVTTKISYFHDSFIVSSYPRLLRCLPWLLLIPARLHWDNQTLPLRKGVCSRRVSL